MGVVSQKVLKEYSYVSFDIFDTLIFRTVSEPKDVFNLIQLEYEQRYGNGIDFAKQRIHAEIVARKRVYPNEVTLQQIYENICCDAGQRERYRLLEQEIEVCNCMPNPPMLELAKWCVEKGKHVIVITDMYLDRQTIRAILEKIGMDYEKLYISSEIGKTKASGELFEYVLKDLNLSPNNIVHTGDNELNDIINPRKYGISSFERVIDINQATLYNLNVTKGDVAKEHQQFFIKQWFRINKKSNPENRIGFQILGPMVYEFCKWLHGQREKNGIDRLLFVAREGYFIKQCYELMYPNDKCGYIYLNRNLLRLPILQEGTIAETFVESINGSNVYTIKNLFEAFIPFDEGPTIEEIISKYPDIDFTVPFTVQEILAGNLKKQVNVLWECIRDSVVEQRKYLIEYLTDNHFFDEKVGLVNNSMNGTGQNMLMRFLETEGLKSNVIGLQFVRTQKCKDRLGGACISWIEKLCDYDKYDFAINALLIEHLLFKCEGTAKIFKKTENAVEVVCEKQRAERRNNEIVSKIQVNALEYIKQFEMHSNVSLGTQAMVDFLEMVRRPLKQDAIILSSLYDDDIFGDQKLSDIDERFEWCYLVDKKIPRTIKWLQGYLVANDFPALYVNMFNLNRKMKIKAKKAIGKKGVF